MPRHLNFLAPIFTLFFFLSGLAHSWDEIDRYDQIVMYRKKIPNSSLLAYRSVGVIDAPLGKLVTVIMDTPRKHEWMPRIKLAEVLRELSPTERIEYVHFKTPWPLKDRDVVYKIKMNRMPNKNEVEIGVTSVEDSLRPAYPNKVRAQLISGTFILRPTENGLKTEVEAEVHTNPRGIIPIWIVNIYQKKIPRESLEGLMKQVRLMGIESHPIEKQLKAEK